MKKAFINIMATTGVTLIVLAVLGTLFGAKAILISSVFQSLGANIVIHLGFLLTHRFESKYILLEAALDVGYTVVVVVVFGAIFDWFGSTPIWVLVLMAVIIYTISYLHNIFRAREEIREINLLLQKRNHQIEY